MGLNPNLKAGSFKFYGIFRSNLIYKFIVEMLLIFGNKLSQKIIFIKILQIKYLNLLVLHYFLGIYS
jgi:hypothetical protein